MIDFTSLTEENFNNYSTFLIKEQADDQIKALKCSKAESFALAENGLKQLLPYGIKTTNNFFYNVCDLNKDLIIGFIWYKINENQNKLFLYQIYVFENFRRKGYGRQIIELLEIKAKELKVQKIEFHVFYHNSIAIDLYKKMNYNITDIIMTKNI